MTANPLVAAPVDTTSAVSGLGVVESVSDLCAALQSGSWVAAGLAGVGAALDVAATVIDPLGSLIGAGLGWLMDHLEPLKGWLKDLTGDAGAVLGFAGTWDNIATAMGSASSELVRVVRTDLEAMTGESVDAYRAYGENLAAKIGSTGESASAMSSALQVCAMVVQAVHDLVRDTLAQLVGSIISWAAEAVFTLGLATPVIVGQVATRVSELATKIGKHVTDVVHTAKNLGGLLDTLKSLLRRLAGAPSTPHGPHAPRTPGGPTTPTRHPSGLPIGDGARRSTYDQVRDPHIHPHNADVVEPDYDPLGGFDSPEDFLDQFHHRVDPSTPGAVDWDWPPNAGAVPGSEVRRPLTAADDLHLDRIGGDGGSYFSPDGTPFSQRALPPDRLNFDRSSYQVDVTNPLVRDGRIMIEESRIAPWFGQPGGGVQYRFFSETGKELSAEMVKKLGIFGPAWTGG